MASKFRSPRLREHKARAMKLLVCGGRNYTNVAQIWRVLDFVRDRTPEPGITCLIDGASDDVTGPYIGADYWAHQWARARGIETVRVHAKWESGKAAGPIRNKQMLDEQKPDRVVAFPGGRGTASMVKLAHAAGVPVTEQV